MLGGGEKDIINIQGLDFIMCGEEEQEKAVFIAHIIYPVQRGFREEDHLAGGNVVHGDYMTVMNHPSPCCPLEHKQRGTSSTTVEQPSPFPFPPS